MWRQVETCTISMQSRTGYDTNNATKGRRAFRHVWRGVDVVLRTSYGSKIATRVWKNNYSAQHTASRKHRPGCTAGKMLRLQRHYKLLELSNFRGTGTVQSSLAIWLRCNEFKVYYSLGTQRPTEAIQANYFTIKTHGVKQYRACQFTVMATTVMATLCMYSSHLQ
jgi:hypothetical protein